MKKFMFIFLVATAACGGALETDLLSEVPADVSAPPDAGVMVLDASHIDPAPQDAGLDVNSDVMVVDAAPMDAKVDVAPIVDAAIVDAAMEAATITSCQNINGAYTVRSKVIFTDCNEAGVMVDAGTPTINFTDSYGSGFASCTVNVVMDSNNCSGNATVVCDDGTQTSSASERIYIQNVNGTSVQAINDVEFKNDATQTVVCHSTEIVIYTR